MGRNYDYINVCRPNVRAKPGLSHDLQLQRDLEIVNARTVAELGSLPPGGLPMVPKGKCIPPQSAAMPEDGEAKFERHEEETMKASQVITVAAVAVGIVACEPSARTEEVPSLPSATVTPALSRENIEAHDLQSAMAETKQERSTTAVSKPIRANATISEAGKLKVEAGDITLHLTASGCSRQTDALTVCNQGVNLHIARTGSDLNQTLQLESIYVDDKKTFYRGALDESNYHTFILTDVNGDGHEDLIVQTGNEGGYGGPSFSVYLFDMRDKMFKFNALFSDLTIGTSGLFIVEHGRLKTWAKNGCCEHFYLTYEIRKNRPVLIEMITETSSEKDVKTIVERLINGEMKKIKETQQ